MCLSNPQPATRKTCIGYKAMWLSRNGKTLRSEFGYTTQRYALGHTYKARPNAEGGTAEGFHAFTRLADAKAYTKDSGRYWNGDGRQMVLVEVNCLDCEKIGTQELCVFSLSRDGKAVACKRMTPLAILAQYDHKTRKLIPYASPTPRIYITTHEDINGLKFYTVRTIEYDGMDAMETERIELITESHDEARRHAERLAFDTRRDLP